MKALLNKELETFFSYPRYGWLAIAFTIVLAVLVFALSKWTAPEQYFENVFLENTLKLLLLMFLVLIPAFSSIHFAKEHRKHQLEKLLVNPTRLYWSRFLLPLIYTLIILLTTLTYVFTDIYLKDESKTIGAVSILSIYMSLLLIISVFISVSLVISVFVSRAWNIFFFGILLNVVVYFGGVAFGLYDLALVSHYEDVLRGLITSKFIYLIINCHGVLFLIVIICLQATKWRSYLPFVVLLVLINIGMILLPSWNVHVVGGESRQSSVEQMPERIQQLPKDIAFIEGHGEIDQVYLLDAEEVLSLDYNVHRGQIENRVGVLNDFAAIIIAGPQEKFSENEKHIVDQYIMQGGRVLWLIDGVYLSYEDLKTKGWSASIKNDVNLDDLLACYGVRVKPQLVHDKECSAISVISQETGNFMQIKDYYSPRITNVSRVSSLATKFMSPVDTIRGMTKIEKEVLFSSSNNSRLVTVPEKIDFGRDEDANFDVTNVPLGIALSGKFKSFYAEGSFSVDTKMIVIGGSSIIRNDLRGQGKKTEVLPMGYDRITGVKAANREFLRNIIEWLTGDVEPSRNEYQPSDVLEKKNDLSLFLFLLVNVLIPIVLFCVIFFCRFKR